MVCREVNVAKLAAILVLRLMAPSSKPINHEAAINFLVRDFPAICLCWIGWQMALYLSTVTKVISRIEVKKWKNMEQNKRRNILKNRWKPFGVSLN